MKPITRWSSSSRASGKEFSLMSSATTTTDHDDIRQWVEKRGGHPAAVADTMDNGQGGALLRIDFDEPGGNDDDRLKRIGWDEFFKIFDDNGLAFLRSE